MFRRLSWATVVGLLFAALMPVVSLAQILPAPPDAAATVVSLTVSVSILKDSQPWALSVGDTVPVRQVIISGPDGHALFKVSDGSTFEVFPNSYVTFRKNPPNWGDLIDLLVGRVKIHIQNVIFMRERNSGEGNGIDLQGESICIHPD